MIYEGTHCRLIRALGWSSVDRETDGLIGRLVIPWLLFRPSRWPTWWQADEYRGRLLVNWLASWWAGSQGASQPDPELALRASQARQPPWKASPTSSCLTAQGHSDWQRCPTLMEAQSGQCQRRFSTQQLTGEPTARMQPREASRGPTTPYVSTKGRLCGNHPRSWLRASWACDGSVYPAANQQLHGPASQPISDWVT